MYESCLAKGGDNRKRTPAKVHIDRLEQVFEQLGLPVRGKKCEGMQHLIAEGNDMISEAEDHATRDALEEEKDADRKLTDTAESFVNAEAAAAGDEEEGPRSRGRARKAIRGSTVVAADRGRRQ